MAEGSYIIIYLVDHIRNIGGIARDMNAHNSLLSSIIAKLSNLDVKSFK
jgi:hypothetical protein